MTTPAKTVSGGRYVGTAAEIPSAVYAGEGATFFATDTQEFSVSDGTTWYSTTLTA
jgi:hypothetical protein